MTRVTAKFYPGARHELLNETNRDEVQHDVVTWLNSIQ
jgi:alpha-beta hydrolase superfamily lysophospholipase